MTPTTPEAMVLEALMLRLFEFEYSPTLPVEWPGEAFTSPDDRKYLRVQYIPNKTGRPFIGSDDKNRYMGMLQVTVSWPINHGELAPREVAGLVANWFPADLQMFFGDVVVRSVGRPTVASSMPDGADLLTPVTVEYESYI